MPVKRQQRKQPLTISDAQNSIQEAYRNQLKRIYKRETEQKTEDYITAALLEGERFYAEVRAFASTNIEKYLEMKDDEKIAIFRKQYSQFYDEYPIVSRYTICMVQYSSEAFKKYLIKCKNTEYKKNDTSKVDNEDVWIQRQCDYIKYLWEHLQKGRHYDVKEAHAIWNQAYKALKKEFNDFRELYEEMEKRVKEAEGVHKRQLATEFLQRLANGEQKLDEETTKIIVRNLKDQLIKQNYTAVLNELPQKIKMIRPTISGFGKNVEAAKAWEYEKSQKELKNKTKLKL